MFATRRELRYHRSGGQCPDYIKVSIAIAGTSAGDLLNRCSDYFSVVCCIDSVKSAEYFYDRKFCVLQVVLPALHL